MPEQCGESIDPAPIRDRIQEGLERIFGPDSAECIQTELLTQLVVLLARWAPRMNLTGHRSPLEMTSRLVLDAAALVAALPELEGASDLADLGSGAGFPGIPGALLRPHPRVYLVDSRQRRHHFQREVRRTLGLDRVEPLRGRSDEIESRPCDVVVAQAMAQPEEALALMEEWARPGGLLVIPASDRADPTMLQQTSSKRAQPMECRWYRVPFADVDRQLWIIPAAASSEERQV